MIEPRVARWLVARSVHPDDRPFLLDDLAEEFHRRMTSDGSGAARRWYRAEAMRSMVPSVTRRVQLGVRAGLRHFFAAFRTGGGHSPMDQWRQDVRYAVRALWKRPAFTAVAVVTLAVGIGANATIFSVANGLLLKPVPGLGNTERLVEVTRIVDGRFFDTAYPVASHYRESSDVLEDLAGFAMMPLAFSDMVEAGESEPQVVMALNTTGNYFELLGVRPSIGRFFVSGEADYPRVEPVVVLSHHLWQERFGGDPAVLGRTVRINDYPVQVIGVASADFGGHLVGLTLDVFVPLGLPAPGLRTVASLDHPESGSLETLARLKPGVSRSQASQALSLEARQYLNSVVGGYDDGDYVVRVVGWGPVPAAGRTAVMAFFGVMLFLVGLVLVLASINVAGMLLSRALQRSREMAVRLSLGASRRRLVRQLLTETVVLFLVAGAAGIVLTFVMTDVMLAFRPALPEWINLRLDLTPDWRVVLFATGAATLAAIIFGLAPALQASRTDLVSALKDGAASASPSRTRLRSLMVAGQMAASLVLLVAAGLFVRSIQEFDGYDSGWRSEGVYVISLDLEYLGMNRETGRAFYAELLERVQALPGIENAAYDAKLPVGGRSSFGKINVAGVEPPEGAGGYDAYLHTVSPSYFETLDVAIERGRIFDLRDAPDTELVAVINEAMAGRLWPGREAVGERFYLGVAGEGTPVEVIGIAENAIHDLEMLNAVAGTLPPNFYYLSTTQRYSADEKLYVRPIAGRSEALADVHAVIRDMAPSLPAAYAAALDELLGLFMLPQRIAAWVVGLLGFLGLLLGAVGVYGVTAVAVGQRTHEIGVRLALGARATDVLGLMMRRGLHAPVVGMVVGLGLAAAVALLLVGGMPGIDAGLLGRVSAFDPMTFGSVLVVLGSVAVAAVLVPSRRASRMDPARTLRSE
jgi:predicted permease